MKLKNLLRTAVITAVATTILCVNVLAAPVNIPDKNLESAIRVAINMPTGVIQDADMQKLKYLDVYNKNITSLEGIQYATNMTGLIASGNAIKTIPSLAKNTKLEGIIMSYNPLESISGLASAPNLKYVSLKYCNSTNKLNLSQLAGASKIEYLDVSENYLTDSQIDSIARLSTITDLNVGSNMLTNLNCVRNMSKLATIEATDNVLTDVSALKSKSTTLIGGRVGGNKLKLDTATRVYLQEHGFSLDDLNYQPK